MAAPVQTTNIHFHEPCMQMIDSVQKKYYIQKVTTNGENVLLLSDWFCCDGVKQGLDRKSEMIVGVSDNVRNHLNSLEAEAVRQLQLTNEMLSEMGIPAAPVNSEAIYKPIFRGNYMYVKLDRDCSLFNTQSELMRKGDAGYGEYRVMLKVCGLYIGVTSDNSTLMASLQLRIAQIQFREIKVACMFDEMEAVASTSKAQQQSPQTQASPPLLPTPLPPKRTTQQPSGKQRAARKTSKANLVRQDSDSIEKDVVPETQGMAQGYMEDMFV